MTIISQRCADFHGKNIQGLRKNLMIAVLLATAIGVAGVTAAMTPPAISNPMTIVRTDEEIHSLLVGTWYGAELGETSEEYQFIAKHFDDGTFRLWVRGLNAGGEVSWEGHEAGFWTVRNGRLETTSVPGEVKGGKFFPTECQSQYGYEIIFLDRHKFVYREKIMQISFEAVSVANDFWFPQAEGASPPVPLDFRKPVAPTFLSRC